jgi:hypothetical protein
VRANLPAERDWNTPEIAMATRQQLAAIHVIQTYLSHLESCHSIMFIAERRARPA